MYTKTKILDEERYNYAKDAILGKHTDRYQGMGITTTLIEMMLEKILTEPEIRVAYVVSDNNESRFVRAELLENLAHYADNNELLVEGLHARLYVIMLHEQKEDTQSSIFLFNLNSPGVGRGIQLDYLFFDIRSDDKIYKREIIDGILPCVLNARNNNNQRIFNL